MNEDNRSFADVKERLDEIVEEVSREDISLDDALALYEEAVKLGLGACNLSENDIFAAEIEAVEGIAEGATEEVASDSAVASEETVADEGAVESEGSVSGEPGAVAEAVLVEASTDATEPAM